MAAEQERIAPYRNAGWRQDNKGGRPVSANPRKLITIRLPTDVIARWKATGPGLATHAWPSD